MSTALIPAAPGTLLLVPYLDHNGVFTTTVHPIVAWRLVPETLDLAPVFPMFTPTDTNRATSIEHGEGGPVSLPALKLTFADRAEWEAYAERICQHDHDEPEFVGEGGEPTDLAQQAREDRDEGPASPDDDTREYGKTADPARQRRTAAEIAEDEEYLRQVEATGLTIRAANSRFKKLGSRAAVLADLRGQPPENSASGDGHIEASARDYGDDADLLG